MPIVEVKGFGTVEFPDNMSQEEITSALQKKFGKPKEKLSGEMGKLQEAVSSTFGETPFHPRPSSEVGSPEGTKSAELERQFKPYTPVETKARKSKVSIAAKSALEEFTLGAVKMDRGEEQLYLEAMGRAQEGKTAEVIGMLGGSAVPFAKFLTLGKMALGGRKLTKVQRAFGEGAIGGFLYGTARGLAEGKGLDEIASEAGGEGLLWGSFGGLAIKTFELLGPKRTEQLVKKTAEQLAKDLDDIDRGTAENLVKRVVAWKEEPLQVSKGVKLVDQFGRPIAEKGVGKGKESAPTIIDSMAKEGVSLYSGLPVDKIASIIENIASKIGTKKRVSKKVYKQYKEIIKKAPENRTRKENRLVNRVEMGRDLGPITTALRGLLSPSFMSEVHPAAKGLVNLSIDSYLQEKRFINIFSRARDKALKGLSKDEKRQVALLLDKFNTADEIPVDVLSGLDKKVVNSFSALRRGVYDPIFRLVVGEGGRVDRVHGYLTRVFQDLDKLPKAKRNDIIKTFADRHGFNFLTAKRILEGRVPREGFFGPLSKERRLAEPELERVWDLDFLTDFYIRGAARKQRLDKFLPEADQLMRRIPEGSRISEVMNDYINVQRGMPATATDAAMAKVPYIGKVARFEGMRQFISKLGLNTSAALINLTQYPINDGTKAIGKALREKKLSPLHDFAKGSVAVFTKRGRMLADRSGVIFDVGKQEVPIEDISGFWSKVARITGVLFTGAERYNKTASFMRNYSELERMFKGLEGITKQEKHRLVRMHAVKGVAETQFFMGIEDKAKWMQGPLGATALRFKTFPIKQLEFISNLDRYEALAFLGVVDVIGGPDALPVLRQLKFELNEEYPDSKITKVLNGLQEYSLAGATGVDLGYATGIGFLPFASTSGGVWGDLSRDFWETVGHEMVGPTVSDVINLYSDISTGKINLDSDLKDMLALHSSSNINVGIQRTARAMKEMENRYIEYERKRKGPELRPFDVLMRGVGFTTPYIEKQKNITTTKQQREEEAYQEKRQLEDRLIDTFLSQREATTIEKKEKLEKDKGELLEEIYQFNLRHGMKTGVFITPDTIKESFVNRNLSLEERISRGKLQLYLLKQRMKAHGIGEVDEESD